MKDKFTRLIDRHIENNSIYNLEAKLINNNCASTWNKVEKYYNLSKQSKLLAYVVHGGAGSIIFALFSISYGGVYYCTIGGFLTGILAKYMDSSGDLVLDVEDGACLALSGETDQSL